MDYDVIVIGAGPAGYVAAIRASQLGLKTACIDKWINKQNQPALGGTCLNVGCIPSKALLESSELFETIQNQSSSFGIKVPKVDIDVPSMIKRKDKIVDELTTGINALFKANKVTWIQAKAKLLANKQVECISNDDKKQILSAKNIIIATGSVSTVPANMTLSGDKIVDSTGALNWEFVPKNLCIIGAGVIGVELGSVWRRLGAKVSILELGDFFANADKKIASTAFRALTKQGMDIKTGVKVENVALKDKKVKVSYSDLKDNKKHTKTFDNVIVAVGRKPNAQQVLADECKVKVNQHGQIETDDFCQTSVAGIYAIGDCTNGAMLAHKASEEGVMVAERIKGQKTDVNYEVIPMVVYTEPEIAWVGKTEKELKEAGTAYNVGEFPFAANGRAKTANNTDGFVKILADAKTDRILGVHMLGGKVSELIAQAVIAMEFEGSSEDLARTIFAHPSLSESVHEAALAVNKSAIHTINR